MKRMFALFLAMVMVVSTLPVSAIAEELETVEIEEITVPETEPVIPEETAAVIPEETEVPEETESEPVETEPEESVETESEETIPDETEAPGETEEAPEETEAAETEPAETVPEETEESTEPVTGEATEETEEIPEEEPEAVEKGVVSSGTCGENLTWTLDDEGTLTISGTGVMEDYSRGLAPWYSKCSSIKTVIIDDGVTSIGDYAFFGCSTVENLYISSLESWMNVSLSDYSSNPLSYSSTQTKVYVDGTLLTDLVIPSGTTKIQNYAFCNWDCITSVTIPDSVTSIGDLAFYSCSSLTSVTIGSGVTSIGNYAFECCSAVKTLYISSLESWMNVSLSDHYSNPLSYSSTQTKVYVDGTLLTDLVIPSGTTKIQNYAFFNWDCITSVTIPDSIKSIGSSAFSSCSSLTSVYIPDSITSVGLFAFYNCEAVENMYITSLESWINGPFCFIGEDASSSPLGTSQAETKVYIGNTLLTNIVIPSGTKSIPDAAFFNWNCITSVTIPNSVTSIGYEAFRDCLNLKSIHFLGNMPKIEENSFYEVTATAFYPAGNTTYAGAGSYGGIIDWVEFAGGTCGSAMVWELDDAGTLTISGSGEMDDYDYYKNHAPWYSNRESIKKVIIEDGVTSIGSHAFLNCVNLAEVSIGKNVTSIGGSAFNECTSLTSVTIPDSVITIGGSAFYDCKKLKSVTFGAGIEDISGMAFYGCSSMELIYISNLEGWLKGLFTYAYSAPFSSTSRQTKVYVDGKLLEKLEFPEGTEVIHNYTCQNWKCLTSVKIPDGVTRIGDNAFIGCQNLKEINIPSSVTAIGSGSFMHCSTPTTLVIPDSVTSIGPSAFGYMKNLTDIHIGSGITELSNCAFSNCTSLKTITIPDTVTTIDNHVFWDCTNLTSVVIGKNVAHLDHDVFYGDTSLKEVFFTGDAPTFGTTPWSGVDESETYPFRGVTATVYYPCSNPTWTEEVRQDYSGKLTWVLNHQNVGNICTGCGEVLGPLVQSVTGPEVMRGGSSAVFKAATSKKAAILWTLRPQDQAFAAVSSSGKLTTKAVAEPVEILLTACLKTDPQVAMAYPVLLVPGAETVTINCEDAAIVDGVIARELKTGNTVQLSADITPASAIHSGTWKSSSAKIATVDADGLVTFKNAGKVKITFTASDGSKKKATVTIVCGTPAEGLHIEGAKELISGQKTTLTAKFSNDPTVKTVTWTSSDPTVAAVSAKGVVTAKTVYEETTVTITAKATDGSGETAEHEITVSPKANVLAICRDGNVVTGKTIALDIENRTVTLDAPEGTVWTSSKPKIAAVENGEVTFLAPGTTVITAKSADGSQSGKVTIKMSTLVTEVNIQPGDDLVITSGKGKLPLKANVNLDASLKSVTWTSSNPAVAAVSSSGVVSAKAGVLKDTEVTITATAKDGSGISCDVTVTVVPKTTVLNIFSMDEMVTNDGIGIAADEVLNGRTLTFQAETEVQLGAMAYPYREDAHAQQNITWKSSSAKVAAITADGTVTSLKAGTVTITAKTADGKSTTVKIKFV